MLQLNRSNLCPDDFRGPQTKGRVPAWNAGAGLQPEKEEKLHPAGQASMGQWDFGSTESPCSPEVTGRAGAGCRAGVGWRNRRRRSAEQNGML